MAASPPHASFLATRQGKLTLALLCAVGFLDFVDASIVNVALPSIRDHLHFSVQSLQWVLSGYLLTYGGFMLLGGRAADLIGRRQLLVAGTSVFALSSLAGGLAGSEGMLVGARLVQGIGAAMMVPAALSILTTSFHEGSDRNTALGVWGALAGLASAVGVFLGGVLSEGPGWRWVFFVNLPVCVLILGATYRLISGERRRSRLANFDTLGAILLTAGMLLLGLRACQGARRWLGQGRDDRGARRRCGPAGRVRGQRAAPPQPAVSVLDLPDQRSGGRGRDPSGCDGRLLLDVLLHHPVHADRARLLADSGGLGLYPGHARRRDLVRDLLAAVRPDRYAPDHRRRRAAGRRRPLLAVAHPRPRVLPHRPAPGPDDHVVRPRRGVRRCYHRRQRRRPGRQGGPRRGLGQRIHVDRRCARDRGVLCTLDLAGTSSPGHPRIATPSPRRGLSTVRYSRAASSSSPPR